MSKISITYPESGLTPSISVVNKTTGVQDFGGTMTEVGTTRSYWYEFSEIANVDYVFTITVNGYNDIVDTLIYEPTGLTESQVASSVRTELSTELARIDEPISSRAKPSDLSIQLTSSTQGPQPIIISV